MIATNESLTYRGRPVESLTREELIEALYVMDRLHRQTLANHQHERDVMATLRRRGTG